MMPVPELARKELKDFSLIILLKFKKIKEIKFLMETD